VKSEIVKKDDIIKGLNLKIKSLNSEIENLNGAFGESAEKFQEEISKRNDDLEFYKRSYEEQKSRVNKEHELISSSLYELALQFMGLKSELQKKVNTNNISFTRNDLNDKN
jgi:septal ring factor EnvC (AmiA/AmiB activator)